MVQPPKNLPRVGPPQSQSSNRSRDKWPAWAKQLPYFRLPPAKENFTLIDREEFRRLLSGVGAPEPDARQAAVQQNQTDGPTLRAIEDDLEVLERELIPLFRERDREAKIQQNRYRLYQISFITLSAIATILGSLLAVALNRNPPLVPIIAFGETLVALLATFLAQISGRESPFPLWLTNRRAAESLRREYFRFLMHLPPYETLDGYKRRILLAERAALINRGTAPDDKLTSTLNEVGQPAAGGD